MATVGGGAIVRPLSIMVGLVERQAWLSSWTRTQEKERATLLCCKESARKSGEIFLVHPSNFLLEKLHFIILNYALNYTLHPIGSFTVKLDRNMKMWLTHVYYLSDTNVKDQNPLLSN